MEQLGPQPFSGYTLQVITVATGFFRPTRYVARLVNTKGHVCREWSLCAPSWQLRRQVTKLREDIEEMLGSRSELPVCYTELPPPVNGGLRQHAISFAV